MDNKKYQEKVRENLPLLRAELNKLLLGNGLDGIKTILERIDRTGETPSWYNTLLNEHKMPNKDGKTAGSIIEKLFVCAVEKTLFNGILELSINPAKGVDIRELDLGVKSPSTNFCTSEPFFSTYDRILGNTHDAIILLTDYQEAKKTEPFKMQITQIRYLKGTEMADKNLCLLCSKLRDECGDSNELKRIIRFIAYINQSDWEAKWLLRLLSVNLSDVNLIDKEISQIEKEYFSNNKKREKAGKEQISFRIIQNIKDIRSKTPRFDGIVNALDNWVTQNRKEFARCPNDNEWDRFIKSPLDGKIGMSLALQWRYNFGPLFKDSNKIDNYDE